MSPFIILAIVFAPAVLAAIVFIAVAIGIHSESRPQLAIRARGPLAVMVRWMLGVYVARPTGADISEDNREECLTGSTTDWWKKGGWDQ